MSYLARYANPAMVEGHGLGLGGAFLRPPGHGGYAEMAWRLAEELDQRKASWTIDPFSPAAGQTIRTTAELIEGAGTCLDFAVTLAAMCLREVVPCHLAVGIESGRSIGHAFVVVQEPNPDRGASLRTFTHAASFESWAELLTQHGPYAAQLIDITPLPREDVSSRIPVRQRSADLLENWVRRARGTIYAVDVQAAVRMAGDYYRLPPSGRDLGLVGKLPDRPPDFQLFESHRDIRDRLEIARELVVLQGPRGSGKSTLALDRALQAEGGRGWFLDGSDERALQRSLADAEARSGGTQARNLQADYLKTMASAAGRRLRSTNRPWVVVLDNAEGDPSKLIELIPKAKRGQLVIVTTTRDDWAPLVGADRILPVDPLWGVDLDQIAASSPLPAGDWLPGLLRIVKKSNIDLAILKSLEGPLAERVVRAALGVEASTWPESQPARTVAAASFMPAERITVGWLADAAFDGSREAPRRAVLELAEAGLLEPSRQSFDIREQDEEPIWMHRLIRATVRKLLPAGQAGIGWSVIANHTPRRRNNHYTDTELLDLADFLEAYVPTTSTLPYAEAAVAVLDLLEPRGSRNVARAAELAEAAMPCVAKGSSHRESQIMSVMLMAHARQVNQANDPAPSGAEIQQGITWCRQAEALTQGFEATEDKLLTGRATAMRGLLVKRMAKFLADARAPIAEQVTLLSEAIKVLTDSYESRKEALEQEASERQVPLYDPDQHIDRGLFNLGGANVDLANVLRHTDPDLVPRILSDAMKAYAGSLLLRRDLDLPGDNTYSAASLWGVALTAYSAAIYCPGRLNLDGVASVDELERVMRHQTRESLLPAAEIAISKALEMRVVVDGVTERDTTKARDLLRKISMAWMVIGGESSTKAAQVLKALKPLFNDVDVTFDDVADAARPTDTG